MRSTINPKKSRTPHLVGDITGRGQKWPTRSNTHVFLLVLWFRNPLLATSAPQKKMNLSNISSRPLQDEIDSENQKSPKTPYFVRNVRRKGQKSPKRPKSARFLLSSVVHEPSFGSYCLVQKKMDLRISNFSLTDLKGKNFQNIFFLVPGLPK